MKRELALFLVIAGCTAPSAMSQTPSSFQQFRQSILDDFESFRKTILEHYADFLNGTWHEYEPLQPLKRDKTPKPMKVPNVKISKPSTSPQLPTPKLADLPSGSSPQVPDDKSPLPTIPPAEENLSPIVPPEAGKIVPPSLKVKPDLGEPLLADLPAPKIPIPEFPPVAEEPVMPEEQTVGKDPVNFYGMEILVPSIDFEIMKNFRSVGDYSRNWKIIEDQKVADSLLGALKPTMEKLGLNDYLAYEFLCAYMDSKFSEAAAAPKMSAVHYLLTHMGYNVRIASTTNTGDPLLLMPVNQTLYAKPSVTLAGQTYYIMSAPGVDVMGQGIATCDLPKVADSGKKFDLIINGLNIPVKERAFEVKHGGLSLRGTLNENLMPIVYNYPQMNTADYALSELDGNLRADLVSQLKEQLKDKKPLAATNELLQFVQSGFKYATDDELHGFEKPYFLEENLYYPMNDCEDRAIFYTYMLWHALGLESELLFFPGHESAGVALPEDIKGTSYDHNGKRYYISDPTYIGSVTGMCMPQYSGTAPVIDLSIPE
ncbi:MAG: hypothetical protein HDR88_17955 [Bacteroides sp.]|nr:hypothetical protein [Bacteroides sp.]